MKKSIIVRLAPKILIILFPVFFGSASICAAETAAGNIPGAVTFELNTDMFRIASPTSRMFMAYQMDVNALVQKGFNLSFLYLGFNSEEQVMGRTGLLLLFSSASIFLNRGFSLTVHDLSHLESARSIGASEAYLKDRVTGRRMSIADFFMKSFFMREEPGLYYYSKNNLTLPEAAYVSGQGLNANMIIAASFYEKVTRGRGHITDMPVYLMNKIWGVQYFLSGGKYSDGSHYVDLLNQQGDSRVNRRHVVYLEAASTLFSGGTAALLKGTFDYISYGETEVKPLGLSFDSITVFWPELTPWLNNDNVSLYVMDDIRFGRRNFFRAGVDIPLLGNRNRVTEITAGVMRQIWRFIPRIETTWQFKGLPFVKAGTDFEFTGDLSCAFDFFYGRKNTMREVREYPSGPGASASLKYKI